MRAALTAAGGAPELAVTKLARESGVGRSTLFAWLSGSVAPTASAWLCVANALKSDPVDLWVQAGGERHNKVWEARIRKGWSSQSLSTRANVSKRTVHNAERGEPLRSDAASRIARALDRVDLMSEMSGGNKAASAMGKILESRRLAMGMSRREFAQELGVSRQLLSAWLSGAEAMTPTRLPQVAKVAEVSVETLQEARHVDLIEHSA